MSHVGIALDHPLNAEAIAYLTRRPSIEERQASVRSLELMLTKSNSPTLAKSLERLRSNAPDPPLTPSQSPDGVNLMSLGALPDIVERLWKVGRSLPTDFAWVAYRRAVLAHSQTGIIFGLAIGTFGIALRLPAAAEAARAEGGKQRLSYRAGPIEKIFSTLEFGPDWWLFNPSGNTEALASAAYNHFGAPQFWPPTFRQSIITLAASRRSVNVLLTIKWKPVSGLHQRRR
jgi:hypothetical protein